MDPVAGFTSSTALQTVQHRDRRSVISDDDDDGFGLRIEVAQNKNTTLNVKFVDLRREYKRSRLVLSDYLVPASYKMFCRPLDQKLIIYLSHRYS